MQRVVKKGETINLVKNNGRTRVQDVDKWDYMSGGTDFHNTIFCQIIALYKSVDSRCAGGSSDATSGVLSPENKSGDWLTSLTSSPSMFA